MERKSLIRLVLLGIIVLLIIYLFSRDYMPTEHFFIPDVPGYLDWTPNTCPKNKELDGALCYNKCKPGFHGIGPICWMNVENVGIGRPMRPTKQCPAGWRTDPITCVEPITGGNCNTHCDGNWSWSDGGFCHTKCEPIVGGNITTRLECSSTEDEWAGLCYSKCPDKMFRVFSQPYNCTHEPIGAGEEHKMSYARDAGSLPNLVKIMNRWTLL
jgi:hypothetical protein